MIQIASFGKGFQPSEAVEAASEALSCLTKLVSVGLTQSQLLQRRALKKACSSGQDDSSILLASRLCWLQHYDTEDAIFIKDTYDRNERKYGSDIAQVCDADPSLLDIILSETAGGHRHDAKGKWCHHSAQRVLGRLQDLFRNEIAGGEVESPELRASGEWEVMLAGTLTSACVHVEAGKRNSSLSDDCYDEVARSEQWLGVCWGAIDGLMPTAALLRFGLSSAGRVAAPFK